ncbi:hypothetical protein [Gelidibacter mesophilus]|nr:hypothetical protein [Gelidibacter mesophilus]
MVVIQDDNDILQPAMTASDHIADRKEKGALFFYNSKPISGDEALT